MEKAPLIRRGALKTKMLKIASNDKKVYQTQEQGPPSARAKIYIKFNAANITMALCDNNV